MKYHKDQYLDPCSSFSVIWDIDIKQFRVTFVADYTRISTLLNLIQDEDRPREDLHTICKQASENNINFNLLMNL